MITTVQSAVKIVIQQHEQAVQKKQEEQAAFTPYWKFPIFDDDDDEYTIQYKEYLENSSNAITPDLSTEEPDNSLSMGDEHLDTILETESDEVIKSSVEDLVPIPSESEGIFDNMCDVPFCDKNHFYAEYDLLESLLNRDTSIVYSPKIDSLLEEFAGELAPINPIPPGIHEADFDPEEDIRLIEQLLYDDYASSDDDPLYSEDIDYVEASPPDSELVSLEEVKDDILREKLLNIYLLIAKIESLNDNLIPDCVLKSPSPFPIPVEVSDSFFKKSNTSLSYSDNSLPEFETFSNHTEETSSGSTTTHADNSLPEYDSFLFETEPDQGELTSVVIEDIFISFIRDPLSLVFDTLLPFSSKNEEKVSILIISDFSESPMMISGGDIPILDVSIAPDYEASRARGFVLRSLELQSLA
ncbi:hypothetical protein Tco_1337639 [Tanacetum coccineum]